MLPILRAIKVPTLTGVFNTMRNLLLAGAALLAFTASAEAKLQLSISDGASTFSCSDGQLGCDLSGGANNLLTVNTQFDGFLVQITLAQSSFGGHNELQLSSSSITATGGGTLTFVASDTSFLTPVHSIESSASLTFNENIGAGPSTLSTYADSANGQGANPLNTPGTLLESVSGTALTNPDSFSGSLYTPFTSGGPFSMTEAASLTMIAGGSVTGFDASMISSAVPEPSTWVMGLAGFAAMGAFGFAKRRSNRKGAVTA